MAASGSSEKNERRVTDGGRDLRAYLTRLGVSVPDFCEQHGLDRIQVQRVMNGERWRRITVDFARAIERATRSEVKWWRFESVTASPLPPPEESSASIAERDFDKASGE